MHGFCTLSAHRLHICPNQGLFCARFAQPAFLCIKRREVRRTRLSSILCVRLRPSAGWLQGSPYRRFLLPPAFRFAGAGVLPGSGLGCRSSLRSSLPVPAGACPACERRCPSGQMRWHDLYSPRLDKMSSHGNNGFTVLPEWCSGPLPAAFSGSPSQDHRRVSHADGHAVFKVRGWNGNKKSRYKTDRSCLRFFGRSCQSVM